MLALLLAVALVVLTILALLLAGVLAAILTGVVLLNAFVLLLGAQSRRARAATTASAPRWRPSTFRRLPEPSDVDAVDETAATDDSVEPVPRPHSITIHRR
jgi:hypothetical protein